MAKFGRLPHPLSFWPLLFLVTTAQLASAQNIEQLIRQGILEQEAQQYSQAEQIWRRVM